MLITVLIRFFVSSEKHEDANLFERMTLIEKEFPGAVVLLMKMGNLPEVRVASLKPIG